MGEGAGISRITVSSVFGKCVLWYVLMLQLPISATPALHRKYNPVVEVSVYSDISEINSSMQAQFVPMFGAPGEIDSSHDGGGTIRLRLESRSGMTLMTKTLLRMRFEYSIYSEIV